MVDDPDPFGEAQAVVVQLLRVLAEVDLDGLGEDLRRLDNATSRRAVTGATLLAEAITRATLGAGPVADALGVELGAPPEHVPLRARGVRIQVHDDELTAGRAGATDPRGDR
ncbi:hypothetical protein N5P18_16200 [Janibacter terrae]|uniref:Uncharacterized protein n=1 Tax=Janibacter terrae TaxID=103817 RepID=A0ABZ2FFZ8_9MICO|nr:hypothetical protein [Janibacter terrae]MBA4084179.1 hypothetical protein [Kytococcus sp.]HBO53870.1 hypothetical protein [Janibacter terrae]HCE61041.1 hypothetical protein [Janibacter terrae]